MRPLLVHFHIYKNAGSSIDVNLKRCLEHRWTAFEGEDPEAPLDFDTLIPFIESRPNILAVSSHQLRPPVCGQLEVFPIVFLRHPLDRLASIYYYERNLNRLPIINGDPVTLPQWIALHLEQPHHSLRARNEQSIFLSRASFDRDADELITNGQNDLGARQAENFLDSVPTVGIVDRFSESLSILQEIVPLHFGITWQVVREKNNTLTERIAELRLALGGSLYKSLEAENKYDLALYERFNTRLNQPPVKSSSSTPINKFAFTGERFVPGDASIGADTQQEHWLRYKASSPLTVGKVVLDAACGEGYGSELLSRHAHRVTGLDIDPAAIKHAQTTYQKKNLEYIQGSISHLPFPDASFDVVISFETIEHVTEELQQQFIAEAHRVLKPDGLFIVSTPNRINYSERTGYHNEFHIHELTSTEFLTLLQPFRVHQVFYQSTMAFPAIWKPGESTYTFHGDFIPDEADDLFLIAICGRETSKPPSESLTAISYTDALSYSRLRLTLLDKEKWIQELSSWGTNLDTQIQFHRESHTRWQNEYKSLNDKWYESQDEAQRLQKNIRTLESTIATGDARIQELRSEVTTATTWALRNDIEIHKLQAQLCAAQDEINHLGKWGSTQDRIIAERDLRITQLQSEVQQLVTWAKERDHAANSASQRAQANDQEALHLRELFTRAQNDIVRLSEWGINQDAAVADRDRHITQLQDELRHLSIWANERDRETKVAQQWAQANEKEILHLRELFGKAQSDIARLNEWSSKQDITIAERDQRIGQLQDEVQRLVIWATERDHEIAIARQWAQVNDDGALNLRERLATAQGDITRLSEWGSDQSHALSERDQRIVQLQDETQRLSTWAIEQDHHATVARQWAQTNETEIINLRQLIAKAQDDIRRLSEWGTNQDLTLTERSQRITDLQDNNHELTKWADDRDAEANRLSHLMTKAQAEITSLSEWGKNLDIELANRDSSIRRLQARADERAHNGENQSELIEALTSRIAALETKSRELTRTISLRDTLLLNLEEQLGQAQAIAEQQRSARELSDARINKTWAPIRRFFIPPP